MERNKVLMVVVSVTFFLAAVVGVGVALLYPRNDASAAGTAIATTQSFDPIEYLRRPEAATLTPDDASSEPTPMIVYGQPESTAPAVAPEIVTTPATESAPGVTQRPATIADTAGRSQERPTTTIQPTITTAPATPRVSSTAPTPAPAPRAPAPTVAPAPSTTAPAAPRTAPAPGTTEPARVTEYWIQLIASPSFDRVEQARARLTEYSLGARVTTRDVAGVLYYRLRVGPYHTPEEAAKFLEWLRRIDGFEAAYVSEEYPVRTALR